MFHLHIRVLISNHSLGAHTGLFILDKSQFLSLALLQAKVLQTGSSEELYVFGIQLFAFVRCGETTLRTLHTKPG